MTRNQFILYTALLVLLVVLGGLYGAPRPYSLSEMLGLAPR